MAGFELLDVVIGMIFVYLLLSLLCSAMNETIEHFAKNRAKDLERGLRELLNDSTGSGLVQKLYDHGLISGLFKGQYDPSGSKVNLPSYIPARNFAVALMDIILPGGANVTSGAAGATLNTSPADALQPLRSAVGSLRNNSVEQALTAIIDSAGNNATEVRNGIEAWFNSSMDRVSGWYKRRAQLIILVLGVCVAILMNVNSLSLANDLWVHKAQRDALVASAQGYSQTSGLSTESLEQYRLQTRIEELSKYNLPVGWGSTNWDRVKRLDYLFILQSICGWLLTAFAVSLGAPFWFDLLNKFIVVRSTVKPREKSAEELSKD
jgi:hypothetical protein